MRVLVLTQYFSPESFRINEVVELLQQTGCRVSVLTGQPNYPDGKVFPGHHSWGMGRHVHPSSFTVVRVPVVPRGSSTAWRLAANYVSFVVSASLFGSWLLRGQRFDVIFVYGISPILQAIPGILLKQLKNAALITWVQDLWPQSLEVTGFITNRRLLSFVESIVRWIYRRNDLLLVQSRAFISVVQSMAGGTPVKYHPNPGELSFNQTQVGDDASINFEPGFNVVFAGNLGTVQALDVVLDAAELLLKHAHIRIVFVGSGSRGDHLMKETVRRGLRNVHFAGRMPPQAMPSVLAKASALLVSLVRSPIMSQTIPSKIQAYLAAGRPIIACLDGEGARVIEEAGAGLACAAEDADALARAIVQMCSMPDVELKRMGDAGRCYYQQHFDPGALVHRLMQHFHEAASKRKDRLA
jgi:glycosyltransferase involved in cell wall biosynthesis